MTCVSPLLMIPPLNSMTAYALGFELDRTLTGSTVTKVTRFVDGMTFELDGFPLPYLHIILLGRGIELFWSPNEIASGKISSLAMNAIHGATISGVHSLDLDRILLFNLDAGIGWGEKSRLVLRLDLRPACRPVTLYQGPGNNPIDSFGPPGARRPSSPEETPPAKPLSLLDLPEKTPVEFSGAGFENALDTIPEHTRAWESAKRTAGLLVKCIDGM
ncbi:MAG: hypothetical protein KAX38_07470, partial [Candidatus Krumholzibacteria bacterium]|nr:hypothetical protein [Candidatus Krumholzibacteria bacterium]